jgi:hypothetical protein
VSGVVQTLQLKEDCKKDVFMKEKRKHIALRFTLTFTSYGRKFVSIELDTNFQQKLGCKTNKKYNCSRSNVVEG